MAYERERDASLSQLISGIVGDAQVLVRQEIALARQEIREEIDNAKQAGIKLGVAAGVLAVGGLLLILALAQGVAALFSWPTWAGYGLVGLVLAIAGYILLSAAQRQIKEVHPIPEKTVETMKENVEWIKERTTSDKI
jgi:protein-S-isoprenylcysteine O-methyltransferase Ste14